MTDAVAQFEFAAPALESQAVSGQVASATFVFSRPQIIAEAMAGNGAIALFSFPTNGS